MKSHKKTRDRLHGINSLSCLLATIILLGFFVYYLRQTDGGWTLFAASFISVWWYYIYQQGKDNELSDRQEELYHDNSLDD